MRAVLRADVAELVPEPFAAAGPGFVDGGAHFAGEGLGGFGMGLVVGERIGFWWSCRRERAGGGGENERCGFWGIL